MLYPLLPTYTFIGSYSIKTYSREMKIKKAKEKCWEKEKQKDNGVNKVNGITKMAFQW